MNEELISDISTTNKDFRSIYSELLDTVKKLSNKWDPSTSNESDPGVLLIKELAVIGDKLNYNIDKNVLECFPASVTQLGNARRLYDELGYKMHWYKSATGSISARLKSTIDDLGLDESPYKLPAWTLITDSSDDATIAYTTLSAGYLANNTDYVSIDCIQGTVKQYYINDSDEIYLTNLDSNLRLYLPETMVAENGIFVADKNLDNYTDSAGWKQVDNILSYPAGNKVFELNMLPDSETCYIQFPQDMAELIDTYIKVKYTISSGLDGNVKSYVLQSISTELTASASGTDISMNDNIKIVQPYPITNGSDPETIDEAYDNYKKQVGVFNTLVTKRDYQSFINDSTISDSKIVSNLVVADRTDDMTNANYMQTWDIGGNNKIFIPTLNSGTAVISPYDIVLYATQPQASIYDDTSYSTTYTPVNTSNIGYIGSRINQAVEDVQSIQHDFNYPQSSDSIKFNIHIDYIIKGLITTYNKVTETEAQDIQSNIYQQLRLQCNAQQLSYGEELPYDDLIEIIEGADARIKTFVLTSLEYVPKMITSDGSEYVMDSTAAVSQNFTNEMLARMIMAGNVQLFEYNTDFVKDFGQSTQHTSTSAIKTLSSIAHITIPATPSYYQPQINETVRVFAPNLVTTETYGSGIKLQASSTITADTDSYLGTATIQISNISGTPSTKTITDCIVNCSTALLAGVLTTLTTGQSFTIKTFAQNVLQDGLPYYFVVNHVTDDGKKYKLELTANVPYILQEGEYFMYSNIGDTNELIILGSGTALICEANLTKELDIISSKDLKDGNFTELDWAKIESGKKITVREMQFKSFGSGTGVKISIGTAQALNNTPVDLGSKRLAYCEDASVSSPVWQNLPRIINVADGTYYSAFNWQVQSRLAINASSNVSQQLIWTSADNYQEVIVTEESSTTPVSLKGTGTTPAYYINFNYPTTLTGGSDLDARVLVNDEFKLLLKVYAYTVDTSATASFNKTRTAGYLKYSLDDDFTSSSAEELLPFIFNSPSTADHGWLVPVYVSIPTSGHSVTITQTGGTGDVTLYPTSTTAATLSGTQAYILRLPLGTTCTGLKMTRIGGATTTDSDFIYIGYPVELNGLNDELPSTTTLANLQNQITTMITAAGKDVKNFNWVYNVESDDKVSYPTAYSSYWNNNHIYNKYTIAKIDFSSIDIEVNPSSIK